MIDELDRDLIPVEALLRRAAGNFPYPETPRIAAAVQARLREQPSRPGGAPGVMALPWQRPMSIAAAVVLAGLVALGAALSVPRSRTALADFFHIRHVQVDHGRPGSPTPPVLNPEDFARPSSAAEAQRLVDFPLRLPTHDGAALQPDRVFAYGESESRPIVILVYKEEGYDLYETNFGYLGKIDQVPISGRQISFDGHDAYWIDAGGHIAQFLDAQGRAVPDTRRTIERASLLWSENSVTYRLETSLSQDEAIAVAQSLQ